MHIAERGVSARILRRPFVHVQRHGGLSDFPVRRLFEHGDLLVLMPDRPLLVALTLAGGSQQDLDDARWWMTRFRLDADEVRAAIATLPGPAGREAVLKNLGRL